MANLEQEIWLLRREIEDAKQNKPEKVAVLEKNLDLLLRKAAKAEERERAGNGSGRSNTFLTTRG